MKKKEKDKRSEKGCSPSQESFSSAAVVPADSLSGYGSAVRPATKAKYREALSLYVTTRMTVRAISAACGVSESGFRSYVWRCHRDLLLARHGLRCTPEQSAETRLRPLRGQSPASYAKYHRAIEACGDAAYIGYNVSQIARRFGLNPTGLGNQLRAHYPELLAERERERVRLGLSDNQPRGARPWCRTCYAAAVELLRSTEMSLSEAATASGVSVSGLRQHVGFYHKDLQRSRRENRARHRGSVAPRAVSGRVPGGGIQEKYAAAVRSYESTDESLRSIARREGLAYSSLWGFVRRHCPASVRGGQERGSAARDADR